MMNLLQPLPLYKAGLHRSDNLPATTANFIVHVAPDKKDGLVFVAIRSEGLEVTPSLIDGANTFRHKQGMMFHSPRSHDRPASSHNKKHSRQRPSMGPPHPTTMSRTTSTAAAEGSRYGWALVATTSGSATDVEDLPLPTTKSYAPKWNAHRGSNTSFRWTNLSDASTLLR